MVDQHLLGQLQSGDGLFAAHAGEVIEEYVEWIHPPRDSRGGHEWARVPTNTGVPPRISGSLWTTCDIEAMRTLLRRSIIPES